MKEVYLANVPFEATVDGVVVEFPADTKVEIDSDTGVISTNWKTLRDINANYIKNNPDIFIFNGVI